MKDVELNQIDSSVDQKELVKFNKTMEEWWDLKGEFKILHEINPVRIRYILDKIKTHFGRSESIELIDIGCGGGIACSGLYREGIDVTGLDANKNNTEAAEKYAKQNGLKIDYINDTVENYQKIGKKYDVVLALEVIEHVANPEEFVKNLAKLLKPNGLIVLSTINRTLKSYFLAILVAEHMLGFMKVGTHDYDKFIRPSELRKMLSDSNMRISELKGLSFDIVNFTWSLSEDIDVNYFATLQFAHSS